MFDCDVRTLSRQDREKEIVESRRKLEQLRQLKENPPDGIDPVELRRQMCSLAGKIGRHKRSFTCSVDELKDNVCRYFEERQVVVLDEAGNVIGVKQTAPITLSGLANYLGVSLKTLCTYAENSDEYGEVISLARSKVMELYETGLVYGGGKNQVGLIFALKQLGWSDEQHITVTDDTARARTSEEIRQAVEADIV